MCCDARKLAMAESPLGDNRLSFKLYKCHLIAFDFRLQVTEEKWRRVASSLLAYSMGRYVSCGTEKRQGQVVNSSISCSYTAT